MELVCKLCPDFSTKSKAVKRRHKDGHKRRGEFPSDGRSEKEGGQGDKGGTLWEKEAGARPRGREKGPRRQGVSLGRR